MYNITNNLFGLLAILGTLWCATGKSPSSQEGIRPKTMNYLGSIDGKSFFAERTPSRSWTDAKIACEMSGMRLASITSDAQETFLRNAYSLSLFTGGYWTGGRDALTMQQIVWDHNLQTPSINSTPLAIGVVFSTCLAYHAQSPPRVLLLQCGDGHGTLCEAIH